MTEQEQEHIRTLICAKAAVAALGSGQRTVLAHVVDRMTCETSETKYLDGHFGEWWLRQRSDPSWQGDMVTLRRMLKGIEENERMDEIMADGNNTLGKLNEHLFAELERLSDTDASDADALKAEIERARAIEGMAKAVVENANTVLTATRMRAEYTHQTVMPKMLEG